MTSKITEDEANRRYMSYVEFTATRFAPEHECAKSRMFREGFNNRIRLASTAPADPSYWSLLASRLKEEDGDAYN